MSYYGDKLNDVLEENKALRRRLNRQVAINKELNELIVDIYAQLRAAKGELSNGQEI